MAISPNNSRQMVGVQYLRAIAALMVAYYHALEQIPSYADVLRRYFLGSLHLSNGVDLFFVISGFIMVLTSSRTRPAEFAVRRVIRIVPLYWALTLVLIALAAWRPELFRTTVLSAESVLKSLLFIPYENPGQNSQIFPLLVPGWSLNFEMFFYAVFTALLFFAEHRRIWIAAFIFTTMVLLAPQVEHWHYGPEIHFFGDFKLFEFLLGMMIARWYARGLPAVPAAVSCVLAAVGFVVLFWGLPFLNLTERSLPQVMLENGLPAALILFSILSLEPILKRHQLRFLTYLGDVSYSMYLSHIFFLGAARLVWARAGLDRGGWPDALGFAVFALTVTVIGSIVVYRGLEHPLLQFFQRAYQRHRRPVASSELAS